MPISENIKPLISNTYDQNKFFKYIYKPWKWIDGEWVKETAVKSNIVEVSKWLKTTL